MRDVEVGEDESRNHASAAEQKAIFCSAAGCRGDERLVSGFQLFDFHTPIIDHAQANGGTGRQRFEGNAEIAMHGIIFGYAVLAVRQTQVDCGMAVGRGDNRIQYHTYLLPFI